MNNKSILLSTDNLNILIIGGGVIGCRKALSFVDKCSRLTILSPELCNKLTEMWKSEKIHYIKNSYESYIKDDFSHFLSQHLIYICTDDTELNIKIYTDCIKNGKLCNRTDSHESTLFSDMSTAYTDIGIISTSGLGSPMGAKLLLEYLTSKIDENIIAKLKLIKKARPKIIKAKYDYNTIKSMSIETLERLVNINED